MHDRPAGPSAFGQYNLETGPFSSIDVDDGRRGRQRAWEDVNQFTFGVDLDVGKKSRRKRMAEQSERERRQRDEEDDGWFADRSTGKQSRKQERKAQREEKRQNEFFC
jgi:protein AIR1/2